MCLAYEHKNKYVYSRLIHLDIKFIEAINKVWTNFTHAPAMPVTEKGRGDEDTEENGVHSQWWQ